MRLACGQRREDLGLALGELGDARFAVRLRQQRPRQLDEDLGVALLGRRQRRVEVGQLAVAAAREPAREQAQPLVRPRLDERADQQRVEQPPRLAAAHLREQRPRVPVR